MEKPLLAALRAVRDEMTKLRVVEVGILNLLGGEPMPSPSLAQMGSAAQMPSQPQEEPRPKRCVIGSGTGRKAGPERVWVAELIESRGPLSVPEILSLKPELDKRQTHNLMSNSVWFERVPDLIPATYQLTARGREEYAKAKAEGQHE